MTDNLGSKKSFHTFSDPLTVRCFFLKSKKILYIILHDLYSSQTLNVNTGFRNVSVKIIKDNFVAWSSTKNTKLIRLGVFPIFLIRFPRVKEAIHDDILQKKTTQNLICQHKIYWFSSKF